MSDAGFATIAFAIVVAFFVAAITWASNTDAEVCRRAGIALGKRSEYSLRYGCFLDGVPSEMIREIP